MCVCVWGGIFEEEGLQECKVFLTEIFEIMAEIHAVVRNNRELFCALSPRFPSCNILQTMA